MAKCNLIKREKEEENVLIGNRVEQKIRCVMDAEISHKKILQESIEWSQGSLKTGSKSSIGPVILQGSLKKKESSPSSIRQKSCKNIEKVSRSCGILWRIPRESSRIWLGSIEYSKDRRGTCQESLKDNPENKSNKFWQSSSGTWLLNLSKNL